MPSSPLATVEAANLFLSFGISTAYRHYRLSRFDSSFLLTEVLLWAAIKADVDELLKLFARFLLEAFFGVLLTALFILALLLEVVRACYVAKGRN